MGRATFFFHVPLGVCAEESRRRGPLSCLFSRLIGFTLSSVRPSVCFGVRPGGGLASGGIDDERSPFRSVQPKRHRSREERRVGGSDHSLQLPALSNAAAPRSIPCAVVSVRRCVVGRAFGMSILVHRHQVQLRKMCLALNVFESAPKKY